MNNIEQLREDLVTVKNDIAQMADGKTDWDVEQWDALESKQSEIEKKLEHAIKSNAKTQSTPVGDPVQQVPVSIAPDAQPDPTHVYGTGVNQEIIPTWAQSGENLYGHLKQEYQSPFVAGNLVKDYIQGAIHGPAQVGDNYAKYCNYVTGLEQTAGVTTTLTNGNEIIPEIMPDVKVQAGARLAGLDMMNIESSSKGVVEYFADEKTYQVDGLIASWTSEGAQLAATRDPLNKGHIELDPLYVFAALTEEIMQDAPLLESRYIRKAPETMRLEMWIQILSGNGVGRPLGILNGPSTISSNRAVASQISYADLLGMEERYLEAGNSVGFYVTNQTCISQLGAISDTSGALIWKENRNDGIESQSPVRGRLFGRPVIVSEDAEALGTVGDFTLVNPAGYLAIQQQRGISFATSPHFFFDTRKMALRWDTRFGGQPYFSKAYTPRKGGSTLSHFVNLDA